MRHHRHLILEDVAALFADHLLAVMGVQLDRDLIAHGSAGHKQRGLAAEDLRRALLQPIDGWVFAINVVANFGLEHGAAHLGRRLGEGVAAQLNDCAGVLGTLGFEIGTMSVHGL